MVSDRQVEAAYGLMWTAGGILTRDKVRAALEAAEAAAWQPIATAPKDGTIIEVCEGDTTGQPLSFVVYRPMAGVSYVWHEPDHGTPRCPTHWRPLPSSPKDTPHG